MHVAAPFDVTSKDSVEAAVAKIEQDVGPIDILVNNAGMTKRMAFVDFPEADWRQIMATNLNSVFFVTQSVARRMIARERGKIVNICSVMSELGRPTIAPYTASKGAVKMLTKAMCADSPSTASRRTASRPAISAPSSTGADGGREVLRLGVRAHARGPLGQGRGTAGRRDLPRLDASSFVNGHILFVDGGMTAVV